jgi:spore coat protein A, manganese oxidase
MADHETPTIGRRTFIRAAGAGLGFVLYARLPGGGSRALAAIPGGTLAPGAIPKFRTPLLVPPVMPRAGVVPQRGGTNADYYEISLRQFSQQVLPEGMPATTVWGYGAVTAASRRGLRLHHAPSLTIEARWGRPVRIKWVNDLVDADGHYLPHLLPVDPTLHWADPPGGTAGRDGRSSPSHHPTAYTGPVPMVTHVHGNVGVGDESDGNPEAWYLPDATDIPTGYATVGTWYRFLADQAASRFGGRWGPGYAVSQYPNAHRAKTEWYHDHTLGMTRLNVYAGPAGFYLIRGGPAGDGSVLDVRTGDTAVLPRPAPRAGDRLPSRKTYYEIPLVIQDRAFNADGSLFYPDSREFFDGATAEDPGFVPETDLSPIWNPEFFGNTITVNGATWPFATVQQRRYRFRVLNGCQSRFLVLDFSRIPGVRVWQIGNEGGFLPTPVDLTSDHDNRLLLALAERADLIVDFGGVPVGRHVLGNVGPDEPFGGGEPDEDFDVADPHSTGQVMQFRVVPAAGPDPTTPPEFLRLPALVPLPAADTTRQLALVEMMSRFWDGPAKAALGRVDADGTPLHLVWSAPVTEDPAVGDTEIWELFNFTADAHPIHIHEVAFEVVDRQGLVTDAEGETEPPARLAGPPRPPEAWERGLKDTVVAYPGEVTRLKATFRTAGRYTWHCHILEHEDNEMMRPFRVGPERPGEPRPHHP